MDRTRAAVIVVHAVLAQALPATIGLIAAPSLSFADETPADIEITPHVAWRAGGSFDREDGSELDVEDAAGFGFTVNLRAQANTQWEIYYGRQSTEFSSGGLFTGGSVVDVDVDYFHGGGTYILDGGDVRPYVVMTIGASRFAPSGADLDDETFFSFSLGTGLRLALGDRLSARIEGRFFTSFVDSDSRLFCASGGATNLCLLEADGSTVTQWQASAGLTLKF